MAEIKKAVVRVTKKPTEEHSYELSCSQYDAHENEVFRTREQANVAVLDLIGEMMLDTEFKCDKIVVRLND